MQDKEGYLLDLNTWNEEIAQMIALQENIILTPEHWQIIYIFREFYQEYQTTPTMRALIKLASIKLNKKIDSLYLYKLFPNGPAKQATKIAGLPKAVRCI